MQKVNKMNVKTKPTPRRHPVGFTLVELVIVLLVLVALAGILVPILPSMVTRAHSASGASSAQQAVKAIQLYESLNFRQPDGWDSLVDAGGFTLRTDRFTVTPLSPAPIDDDDDPINNPPQNQAEIDLGARISSALNAAGITFSYTLAQGMRGNGRPEGHANRDGETARVNTFNAYAAPVGDPAGIQDLTGAGSVVTLGPGLNEIVRFGFVNPGDDPSTVAYVVFGIGDRLTAVGQTMSAAPVHFPEVGDLPPTLAYSRFVAIYRIPTNGPAELATVAAIHEDHLDSIGSHLAEYYETVE